MAKYEILDESNNVIDSIIANESFVNQNYLNYRLYEEPSTNQEEEAREWRDTELFRTDSLMLLSDYPYKEQLTAYRQELRDWPSTADFPDTKPVLTV